MSAADGFLIERSAARLRAALAGRQRALALCAGIGGVSAAVYCREKTGRGTKNGAGAWEERLGPVAHSRHDDFDAALADVLRQLAAAGPDPLPARARLAAQTALPGVIELPVNPARPRKDREMRALTLAEMEAAYIHFNGLWTLGALLMARGALTAQQCEEVALELDMRRAEGGNAMFGELAVQMGHIGRPALEAALRAQETLHRLGGPEAALACAWRPARERTSAIPAGPGLYRWLACAAPRESLDTWRHACRRHGLTLDAIYPLAWCALAENGNAGGSAGGTTNAARGGEAESATLQLHDEEWALVCHTGGNPSMARNEPRMDRPAEPGRLAALLDGWLPANSGGIGSIELQAWSPAWDESLPYLAERMGELLGRPPLAFAPHAAVRERVLRALGTAGALDAANPLGISGARGGKNAADTTAGGALRPLPHLPGRAPVEFSAASLRPMARYLAPAAVLLALAGVEANERLRLETIRKTYTENEQKTKTAAALASSEQRLKTELAGKRRELDRDSVEYTERVKDNQRFASIAGMRHNLPDLIRALARSADGDVVIDRIANGSAKSDATRIQVVAWSPHYAPAQNFATRAQGEIARLGFGIALSEINTAKGRQEQEGYRVSFWLVPADDLGGEVNEKASEKADEKTGNRAHAGTGGAGNDNRNSNSAAPAATAFATTPAPPPGAGT